MRLTALDIRDFRIVAAAAFEPGADFNLIVGPNAAGKTSLLEAIHVLATGRSFAATRAARLVRHGGGPLRVIGRVQGPDGAVRRLGLERGRSGPARTRLDGAPAERVSDLARVLPVIAVHPESHDIVGGGPDERRRLLDLGLFHVEPAFHERWRRYRRALAQRNALLRGAGSARELEPWERELASAGETLNELRRRYVEALAKETTALQALLFDAGEEMELAYRRGWSEEVGLLDALIGERRGGYGEGFSTGVGPHRADLVIRSGGRDVRQQLSRGQQKLLVYLLRLAQARQLEQSAPSGCVLLLDDLPAELDAVRRARVTAVAREIGAQVFVTALDPESIELPDGAASRMFHVEQGWVRGMV